MYNHLRLYGAVVRPWSVSASHVECHPSQIATWRGGRKAEPVPSHSNWQELLYDVDLAPVWKALDELNRDNRFRFFPIMARYSKASVYKLQASSFCERVNSAGKIVFSDQFEFGIRESRTENNAKNEQKVDGSYAETLPRLHS